MSKGTGMLHKALKHNGAALSNLHFINTSLHFPEWLGRHTSHRIYGNDLLTY